MKRGAIELVFVPAKSRRPQEATRRQEGKMTRAWHRIRLDMLTELALDDCSVAGMRGDTVIFPSPKLNRHGDVR